MQLLSNNISIKDKLIDLISNCKNMQIAVAWATSNHEVFKVLLDNRHKINKFIVGTHFYQTDPRFLENFIGDDKVKVIKNSGEVFHPKIYYFNTNDGWECLIGSANFTNGAMNKNEELMICITADEYHSKSIQNDIWIQISKWFNMAHKIDNDYVEDYKKHYNEKQKSLQILSSGISIQEPGNSFKSDIFSMSWKEYFNELSLVDGEDLDNRLKVITEARTLFKKYTHFNDFSHDERKKIAGFYEKNDDGIDWLLFGSMKGNGLFKEQINSNNPKFSEALDYIPFFGIVSEENYLDFINKFKQAFTNEQNRLSTATRLLAMKRPDYFICLDSKNKKQFCFDFGLQENEITIDNYWAKVVEKIIGCLWWGKDQSELFDDKERNVHISRVSFLDKLYYNNIPRANPKSYISKHYPELLSDSSIKIVSSRRWEKSDNINYRNNWWFKFSDEALENYKFIVFAGAEDYKNDSFKLLKIPTSFIQKNLSSFDINADGLMINLYILFDTYIDSRNVSNISFQEFVIN